AEAARLSEEAERCLTTAEESDDPEDWDAWKEADGVSTGFKLALDAIAQEAESPDPTPSVPAHTCEDWLDNLADLRADAEDLQHYIDELNRTLAYGGIPNLGLAPDDCQVAIAMATARAQPALAGLDLISLVGHLVAAIAALNGQLATMQAQVAGSRHSEAFAHWAATYQPVRATDRSDAPFGGILFDTSDQSSVRALRKPEAHVWTLISDGDALVIVPGFRRVDRLGHFICAVAREADAPTEIVIG
ncbi:MAG: hypothetical protein IM665_05780, partial [Phenylobacterium sp.]|nr:hypothetical protein [Phenylobacterium sp.]